MRYDFQPYIDYYQMRSSTSNYIHSSYKLHAHDFLHQVVITYRKWLWVKDVNFYVVTPNYSHGPNYIHEIIRHYVTFRSSQCTALEQCGKTKTPSKCKYCAQCQILGKKYLQIQCTSYFRASLSLQMFTGPLFQIKLHLLWAVLLSGFQSSTGALKSTE